MLWRRGLQFYRRRRPDSQVDSRSGPSALERVRRLPRDPGAQIGRSQTAVSKALRSVDEPETRYVKICVDVIEHYRDDVAIHYPQGQVDLSA